MQAELYELTDVAQQLGVSPEVVKRFIRLGLVFPAQKHKYQFTRYGVRRLKMVLDLYEKSIPMDRIEAILNH